MKVQRQVYVPGDPDAVHAALRSAVPSAVDGQIPPPQAYELDLGAGPVAVSATAWLAADDSDVRWLRFRAVGASCQGGSGAATLETTVQPDGTNASQVTITVDLQVTGAAQTGRTTARTAIGTSVADWVIRQATHSAVAAPTHNNQPTPRLPPLMESPAEPPHTGTATQLAAAAAVTVAGILVIWLARRGRTTRRGK